MGGRSEAEEQTGWLAVRQDRRQGAPRAALAFVLVIIAILAGLALLDSFSQQATQGGAQRGPDLDRPGGNTPSCDTLTTSFAIAASAAGALMVALLAIAITMARSHGKRLFESVWAWLALASGVLALILLVIWLLIHRACNPRPVDPVSCDTLVMAAGIAAAVLAAVATAAILIAILRAQDTGRSAWDGAWAWVAVGAIVLFLLSLVAWALISLACEPPEPDPREPPTCSGVTRTLGIGTGALVLLAGGLLATAFVRARGAVVKTGWFWGAVAAGILATLVGVVWAIVAWLCSGGRFDLPGGGSGGGGRGRGQGSGSGSGTAPVQPPPDLPVYAWILIALAAVALVAFLLSAARRRRLVAQDLPQPDVAPEEQKELREILDRGDLQSTQSVIAVYRAFLAWAGAQGLPKALEDTPAEHAARVAQRFSFPPADLKALVAAYQVARLSLRDPDQVEREAALSFRRHMGPGP